MNPEDWQRIEPLYRAALNVPSSERQRFLAAACESQILRREVEALLKDGSGETVLDDPGEADSIGAIIPRSTGALTPGQLLLGRFRIVRLLGWGGMGDVYEAMDLELGRIALKTIRSDIANHPEALARFKREVQLARRVSGPEVCRIHELFVAAPSTGLDALVFLTMEFLEGVTLADKIATSGPMSWERAESIVVGICAGLTTIHAAGIIHRDLKGRNVMLAKRNGVVCPVLMDFGLAHEVSKPIDNDTGITRPGVIIGTPDYMAPEQFQGKAVSPATDVYAVGVILYEMLTGKQPFEAETPFESAVLRGHQPPAPSSITPKLPRRADRIVSKCLEYKPECRFQSAAELANALTETGALKSTARRPWSILGASFALLASMIVLLAAIPAARERLQGMLLSSREKHIAVLPIDFSGGDVQSAALADGLMDSLSGQLSNLNAGDQTLWVIPASRVRALKVKDAPGALRELGATIVVEGRMEFKDRAPHLALTLIDTRKMRQIGYTELDSADGDFASMENEAVTRLGRLMNLWAPADRRGAIGGVNHAAYEDYLTAVGYIERYDKPGNLDLAIGSLQRSIARDDQFALAYAQIGEAYRLKYNRDKNPQWLEQAGTYAEKAAKIDSSQPKVYVTLARIHERTGKHDLAMREFHAALQLDPRNADALSGLANAYENGRRLKEAEVTYKQAIALRPDYWDGYNELGNFYDRTERSALAVDQYGKAIHLVPDNADIYANLGGAYIGLNDYGNAELALKRSTELSPNSTAYANLGYLYTREKRYAESAEATERALQLDNRNYQVWENLINAYDWLRLDAEASTARRHMLPIVEQAAQVNPLDSEAQAQLAVLSAHDKLVDKAHSHIQAAYALASNDGNILASIAVTYEVLGEKQRAIDFLSKAFKNGYTQAAFMGEPELQGLRSDPMVRVLLR